jgi:hypothetical protein
MTGLAMATKARTEGQKRKERKDRQDGPREPNGQLQRPPNHSKAEASARMAMVEARAKRLGVWPAPLIRGSGETDAQFAARDESRQAIIRAATSYVMQPWMGCNAGRAIKNEPDVVALWGVITAIRQRWHANLLAIDGMTADVSLMRMPTKSDPGPDEHRAIDLRSPEEKTRDAIDAWDDLMEICERLGPHVIKGVMGTVLSDQEPGRFPLAWALGRIKKAMDA